MRCLPQDVRDFSTSPMWLDIQDKLQEWTLDCLSQMADSATTEDTWRHLRGVVEAIGNMNNIVEWLCPSSLEAIEEERKQEQEQEQEEE